MTRTPLQDVELGPFATLDAWTFLHVPRMGKVSFGETGGYGVTTGCRGLVTGRRCAGR